MELWIRSQDKTKLVKVDNIAYMDSSEDYEKEVHSLWNDCKGILGTYETKERALEVLNEIQEAQLGNFYYRCPSNVKVSSKEDTIVYQMPEK